MLLEEIMQFHIMNNGIDSLRFGLKHYNIFLENCDDIHMNIDEYFSDLKFSTVAFHNAIELFTKKILYDVNELLIFNVDTSDKFIAKALYQKYTEGNADAHLDYWTVGKVDQDDPAYKTIDYKKSIAILQQILSKELSECDYKELVRLGKMRNLMTHLGYWDDFFWYRILITINKCLGLINKFYYKQLRNGKRYFDDFLLEQIKLVIEKSEKQIKLLWWSAWEGIVNGIIDYFEDEFKQCVENIELDIEESSNALNNRPTKVGGIAHKCGRLKVAM